MKIFLTFQFLEDLKAADDQKFVRRVLNQVYDSDGRFRLGQDDHRYHGIPDAWIRYVSKGKTGYRLIYIRQEESIYLYRAGVHSVEDDLSPPKNLALSVPLVKVEATRVERRPTWDASWLDTGDLLKTTQEIMLKKVIQALSFVGHHEIVLVSPFVSEGTVARTAPFGQFLDRAVEEGTSVWLVTRPPEPERLEFFRTLEARDIGVYFYKSLHAKLYLFEVNQLTLNEFNKDLLPTAIIGSANLTDMGLALTSEISNEELCYRLPELKYQEAKDYAHWLINHSEDVTAYRLRSTRRF